MDRTLIGLLSEGPIGTFLAVVGAVFVVIAVIWAFRAMVKRMNASVAPKKEEHKPAVSAAAPAGTAVKETGEKAKKTAAPLTVQPTDEVSGEVIAVITAAIAAMENSAAVGSSPTLVIRKISRATGNTTSWSSAGLTESIDRRML